MKHNLPVVPVALTPPPVTEVPDLVLIDTSAPIVSQIVLFDDVLGVGVADGFGVGVAVFFGVGVGCGFGVADEEEFSAVSLYTFT